MSRAWLPFVVGGALLLFGASLYPVVSGWAAVCAGLLSAVVLLVRRRRAAKWARVSADVGAEFLVWRWLDKTALALALLGVVGAVGLGVRFLLRSEAKLLREAAVAGADRGRSFGARDCVSWSVGAWREDHDDFAEQHAAAFLEACLSSSPDVARYCATVPRALEVDAGEGERVSSLVGTAKWLDDECVYVGERGPRCRTQVGLLQRFCSTHRP